MKKSANGLNSLLIDVGVPIAGYYVLTKMFGMDAVAALALSSVVPATRAVWSVLRERRVHALAVMMLLANGAGIALSLLTDDARLLLAKDSVITGTIGLVLLVAAAFGRPLLSSPVEAAMTDGNAAKAAAWHRLPTTPARFRRAELVFSAVWGFALLAECAARVAAVFTLPVDAMVWLGPVMTIAMIFAAIAVTRRTSMAPMLRMLHTASAQTRQT